MGILEQVLAGLDASRRTVGRNVSDLIEDPALYAEKLIGHLRNQNAGVAPTIANGELTNRMLSPSERVQHAMETTDFGGGLGVIKPKGGNWLSGQYGPEAQLKGLKGSVEPLNQWIDNQLTKYVKNDMASPTDPIRKLADAWPAEKAEKLAVADARIAKLRQKQQAQAATRGVPEEYLTQTRQDILKAEESRDLIDANRGLHYEPAYGPNPAVSTKRRRAAGGFPEEGVGQTELARAWETTADSLLGRSAVADFQLPNNLKQDPWLAKADPTAPVYILKDGGYEPGFAHLIDELRNSVVTGKITPEQLQKMPIDQAVRHVAEINALRAVESNKASAMDMADMPVHKDYPEQGYSWRQLKHEDEPTLQKWLTQEGDAMGHCVGGYCPDVKSGASSIYSLRDAKGQPHVTIETRPFDTHNMTSVPSIVQIKGKNNAAPKAEHLPFIQDFIKSGKWSEIGDAANTGLTPEEIQQLLKGQ